MSDTYHIHYLQREQIDRTKWDCCIDEAPNGLVYAYTFYLDNMAKQWDALVLNDYEVIMPLTWNKKWGIKYLYQPPLTQQLGIFSRKAISADLVFLFLQEVKKYFRFAEIFLNYNNYYPGLRLQTNYILELKASYNDLHRQYKKVLEKNLKRAFRFHLNYAGSDDLEKAIDLCREKYGHKIPHVRRSDYRHFEKVCRLAQQEDGIVLREVSDEQNDLLALALLLKKNNRMYLLMSCTLPEGKRREAYRFLLDNLIREFAGKDLILDFEGSDIPGIANFYRNFGGIDQPYFFYQLNQLPWPLRLLK